ncbi:MAG: hypothetical protein ACJAZ2_001406 [Glaciecola sp.]|jgi:hypothetical protein
MKLRIVFSLAILILAIVPSSLKAGDAISGKLPYINVSWGLLSYKGDLSKVEEIGTFHNPTFGIEYNANYVFWNTLGLELHGLYGTLSHEQNTTAILHNFKTTMIGGGLNVSFHLNNGFILPVNSKIGPFIYAGVTPFAYWAQGDFSNGDDFYYSYWSDGSIRNIDEKATNANEAVVIRRDYDYERSYRGINGDDLIAISYNMGGGFSFEITDWLAAQLRVSYSVTNSDFLDGYEGESGKDNYVFGNFGLTLDPNALLIALATGEEEEEEEELNVDDFLTMDTDGDGVPDLHDKCSGTPGGTDVSSDGCAKSNGSSDETDSLSMMPDSLVVLRNNLCRDYPMLCGEGEDEYLEIDGRTKRKIEVEKREKEKFPNEVSVDKILKVADLNNDGKVELPELYNAIELFFDGKADISLPELRKLIDHFFDQY